MSKKMNKPRLSKGILEMKFMKRTKEKVDKEQEEAEGRQMYSNEITDKMLNGTTNFIIEPSYIHCENLIEGRLSFRGMNPEIERLLELEQQEKEAAKKHEQPKDVTDKDMAALYHKNQAPAVSKTLQKKFQTKNKRKSTNQDAEQSKQNTHIRFKKPKNDSDEADDSDN